ncbi:hypothetical protein AB0M12_39095 [Nocardia vinacea]
MRNFHSSPRAPSATMAVRPE